jgi:hypothetical protein
VAKGGWKKRYEELLRTVAQPASEQRQDGTSSREVHDPVVPYQDHMPEDDASSMPIPSTVPCTEPSTDLASTKAYRDAVPGPADFPVPSRMSPGRAQHGDVLQGHVAPSPGYSLPRTFDVPRSAPNAADIARPPLTAGHASPSPSNRKR